MNLPRVVVVGAGFAGYHAAKTLSRQARGRAEIVLVNSTDYFLYVPLLPEVATGLLEPRRLTISLADTLPGIRLVLGEVDGLDLEKRRVKYGDPAGRRCELEYDRLIIAVGSVNRLLPVPGIAEHAHGFRGIPEALFLRDHLTQQIELADGTDDQNQRDALVQDEGGLMLAVTHAIDPHNVTLDVDLEPVLRRDRSVMGWVKLGPHTH